MIPGREDTYFDEQSELLCVPNDGSCPQSMGVDKEEAVPDVGMQVERQELEQVPSSVRYYEGFDWRGVCNNPVVRNYITQQCDLLVTSDGNALTSEGKREMEGILCPQGRGIIGIIEFAYKSIPDHLENELAAECGWS